MIEELNMSLFADLSRLGIRQVTLTKEAAGKLSNEVKGLFRPDLPDPDWESSKFGEVVGISFFVETD